MSMRTRKIYIIIEMNTNRILHSTTDRNESMKEFDKLIKAKAKVTAECIYQ